MHKISKTVDLNIFPSIALMTAPMLNPCAIPYSSAAKTLRVTHLHLIKDQCMIFTLLVASARQIIKLICNDISLLFANEKPVKTISYSMSSSSLI